MTDIFAPAVSAPTAPVAETTNHRLPRGVLRVAGAALIAFPLLITGGMIASPLQTEPGDAGYIASLARDPFLSHVSANLLHYGWVALALGVLATLALVGRRGRVWVSVTAMIVLVGAVQLSGLLLSDWFLISAGTTLPMEQAVALNAAAQETTATVWLMSAQAFTLLGIPALTLGLARAGVVSWWIAPLPLLAFAVPFLNLGIVAALAFAPLMAPVFVAGWKLLRR